MVCYQLAICLRNGFHAGKNRLVELFESLFNPRFGTLVAVYFFLVTAFSIMTYAFVLYTIFRFGYNAEQNGYIFAYIGILAVIFQGGVFTRLVERFGENPLTIAGCLMMTAGFFAIPFLGPDSGGLSLLLAVVAVMAVGNAMAAPAISSLASKTASESEQGKALGVMQSGASLARAVGQFGHALDRIDLRGKLGEDRGLVAAPGPDFQHAVLGADLQCFGHVRDDVRLGDGLTVADRDGPIFVGFAALLRRQEVVTRHLRHGIEHARVADAARLDLLGHHSLARLHGRPSRYPRALSVSL